MRLDISDEDVDWGELARHIIDDYGESEFLPMELVIKTWVIRAINLQLRLQKEDVAAARARRRAQAQGR